MSGGPTGELFWRQGRPCESGECVEVASLGDSIRIRSSANREALLTMSRAEWSEFLSEVKDGLFDDI